LNIFLVKEYSALFNSSLLKQNKTEKEKRRGKKI